MIAKADLSVALIPLAKDEASKAVSWPMNFNGKQNGELVFGGFRLDAEANQMVVRTDAERESAAERDGDPAARKLREPWAGIAKLDQNNHVRTTFTRRDGLISDSVTGAVDKFGKWYFATGGGRIKGGLAIFDPETTIFTSLTTLDGLAINSVNSIHSKGSNLN